VKEGSGTKGDRADLWKRDILRGVVVLRSLREELWTIGVLESVRSDCMSVLICLVD
jgi:hypothetical protein